MGDRVTVVTFILGLRKVRGSERERRRGKREECQEREKEWLM